jgi:hypothetical protein
MRSGVIQAGVFVAGLVLCWAAYSMTNSTVLTISTALTIGFLSFAIDLKLDPLFDPQTNSAPKPPSSREKVIWAALFLPPVVLLGAVLTYLVGSELAGPDLFWAVLIAMLLGFIAGATTKMFYYDKRSDRSAQEQS